LSINDFLNKITQADCWDILCNFPDKSVDLLLTDPPYGILHNLSVSKTGKFNDGDTLLARQKQYPVVSWDDKPLTQEQVRELIRISKNQIIFGGNYIANFLPVSRGWVVWDKRAGKGEKDNDRADCELIWTSFDVPAKLIRHVWWGMFKGQKEERYHPTQKPLFVCEKLLTTFASPNQLICDPFAGSGSILVACQNVGCQFIGIEKEAYYVEVANNRLKANNQKTFLDGFGNLKR
jgi:DNA modification methylase